MESGSQILNYKGDPGLAYGTAGTEATAAPIGVLQYNNNGFDNLAHYTLLKNKDLYDQKIKEQNDMFKAAKDLDLSTAGLLDVDRQAMLNGSIKNITDYLLKHPNAQNPKTPQQIQENIKFNQLYDQYRNEKAIAQTRYGLNGLIQKDIADNPVDRESKVNWYDPQLKKPLVPLNPYQLNYNYDPSKLKGAEENTSVESYVGDEKRKIDYKSNLATTLDKADAAYNTDKQFKGYIDQNYPAYLEELNKIDQKKQELVAQGRQKEADQLKSSISDEVGLYNNYAGQWNTVHPERLLPIIDPTKLLSKQDFARLYAVANNVSQTDYKKGTDLSDKTKFYTDQQDKLKIAQSKAASHGINGSTYNVLLAGVNAFRTENNANAEYEKGINKAPNYKVVLKGPNKQGVFYNGQNHNDVKVVITPDGRNLAKVDGDLVEYTGSEWQKVEQTSVPVDDNVIRLYGKDAKITTDGKKLHISGNKIEGGKEVPFETDMDRNTYLRFITTPKEYDDTIDQLRTALGSADLNNDEIFDKAVKLVTTGTFNGDGTDETTTQTYKFTYQGKDYTIDQKQLHEKASKSGYTDQQYIDYLKTLK